MVAAITLKKISKIFLEKPGKRLTVLENISLQIFQGEIFIFLGPSGSGKSTLLRIMSALDKSFQGEVKFGQGISKLDTSFVFQQFALLPWLTVFENIELGLVGRHIPLEKRRHRVQKELNRFGLEKFARAYPRDLSGGMKQRVGIARALATDPKVIFMDEPFSELDSFTARELRQELLNIWQASRPTIVMVSHNIIEALELADRIAVLTPLPGRIEKIVSNNLSRPRQQRSPEFYELEDQLYKLVKP